MNRGRSTRRRYVIGASTCPARWALASTLVRSGWGVRLLGQTPIPDRDEARYRVTGDERRTATIVELWLRPFAKPMASVPGEYVLSEAGDRLVPPRSYRKSRLL